MRAACVQVTVSDGASGDTLRSFTFKGDPIEMAVADKKEDGSVGVGGTAGAAGQRRDVSLREGSAHGAAEEAGACHATPLPALSHQI